MHARTHTQTDSHLTPHIHNTLTHISDFYLDRVEALFFFVFYQKGTARKIQKAFEVADEETTGIRVPSELKMVQ